MVAQPISLYRYGLITLSQVFKRFRWFIKLVASGFLELKSRLLSRPLFWCLKVAVKGSHSRGKSARASVLRIRTIQTVNFVRTNRLTHLSYFFQRTVSLLLRPISAATSSQPALRTEDQRSSSTPDRRENWTNLISSSAERELQAKPTRNSNANRRTASRSS